MMTNPNQPFGGDVKNCTIEEFKKIWFSGMSKYLWPDYEIIYQSSQVDPNLIISPKVSNEP